MALQSVEELQSTEQTMTPLPDEQIMSTPQSTPSGEEVSLISTKDAVSDVKAQESELAEVEMASVPRLREDTTLIPELPTPFKDVEFKQPEAPKPTEEKGDFTIEEAAELGMDNFEKLPDGSFRLTEGGAANLGIKIADADEIDENSNEFQSIRNNIITDWQTQGTYGQPGYTATDATQKARDIMSGVDSGVDANQDLNRINDDIENWANQLLSYNIDQDPAYQAQVQGIQSRFGTMRSKMQRINESRQRALQTRGYRRGGVQFAGEIQLGIEGEEINDGMERIAQINSAEASAISAARQAYQNQKYQEFGVKMEALQTIRDNKADELEKLQSAVEAANEKLLNELEITKTLGEIASQGQTNLTKEYNFAVGQGFEGSLLDYQAIQQELTTSMPTSYREWQLAGGQEGTGQSFADYIAKSVDVPSSYQEWSLAGGEGGTGKTFAQWIDKGVQSELDKLLSPNELSLFNAPAGSTLRDVMGQVPKTELTGVQKFQEENTLAKEFENLVGDGRKAAQQIGIIQTAYEQAKKANAEGKSINAASQGVLVAFQKLLDPTSVVRESEYARSGEGASLWERIKGKWTKIEQGGAGLTKDGLTEFVELAGQFLIGYQDTALQHAKRMEIIADQRGLYLPSILTQDMIDILDRGTAHTLDSYYKSISD